MNRLQYFWLGLLSIIMLCVSTLFIGAGRIVYGVDAFILAVMGWMFMNSIEGLIQSVTALTEKGKVRE